MIRELKKEAKQFISDTGYAKGAIYTEAQVSNLMARFTANVINRKQKEQLIAALNIIETYHEIEFGDLKKLLNI